MRQVGGPLCPDPRRFSQLQPPRTWQCTLGQCFVIQLPPKADGDRGREGKEIKGLERREKKSAHFKEDDFGS